MGIKELLLLATQRNASDLHLIAGVPPYLRIDGALTPIANEAVLTPSAIEEYAKEILSSEQIQRLKVNKELDFSVSYEEKSRFRVNAYTNKTSLGMAFRLIPTKIPKIDELSLPKILHSFTDLRQGFILITGPTGHGKSTTLAAMLDEINKTRSEHIVTIEDPIEFVIKADRSIISQREMGTDTHSWKIALRSVLREDPNVVMVGEMRDFETISAALTVAETGHLVFATLHTNSAAQTVDRIVDVFPEEQQEQIRLQLSNVIEAVFSMRLIPAIEGGRLVAYEVMLGTPAVRTSIREAKTHQIDNILQTSTEVGMNTLEMSLASLVKSGKITLDIARSFSLRPGELTRLVRPGR